MRTAARCAALLALIPLLSCSSFEQRVVAVENRQTAIEQQIAELQQAQMDIVARLARVQNDLDGALDPLRVQQADRGEDMRALQREVTAMEEQIAEIDSRIGLLREDVASGGGRGAPGTTAGPAMPPARGQRNVDPGGAAPAPQDDAAQSLYNSSYNDYLRDNHELCVQGFEEFLRLYPTSARAANSQYWIGMCQRDLGRLSEARTAFGRVISDYPDSDVVADALFMDALILQELGRTEDAIEVFRRLVQAYPTRDQALLACGRLTELGAELPETCAR